MSLTTYSGDPNVIAGLPTYPSVSGMTIAQLKAFFDQDNVAFKAYFNSIHLLELESGIISTIERTVGDGSAGTSDTYTITFADDSTTTFTIYNGVDGAVGATGPQGDAGIAGAQGIQGIQGTQGIQGDTGVAGNDGPIGPDGPIGLTGPTGAAGADSDMLKVNYDPNSVEGDAFDMANMSEGSINKILTATERATLANAVLKDGSIPMTDLTVGTRSGTTGINSVATGFNVEASGDYSHAEGYSTDATGDYSHAEGFNAAATGATSHAEGFNAAATGDYSHAQNKNTMARGKAQTAIGRFNVEQGTVDSSVDTDHALIIGNGTNAASRSNALTVTWNGDVDIPAGASYKVGGVDVITAHNDSETAHADIRTDVETLGANFQSTEANESATLGTELVDGTGWTIGTGWAGDFATGFVHTPGNTANLSRSIPSTGTNLYEIDFHVESPTAAGGPNASTDFEVTIGNSAGFIVYKGGGDFDYKFGIRSISDGDLVISPGTTFDGTISDITVKQITAAAVATSKIVDSTSSNSHETRATLAALNNLFLGLNSGEYNTLGNGNVGVGANALSKNTTGYWNSALGWDALKNNTVGSRNVAIGKLALEENISGDRNIAIGTYTLKRNTIGRQNIALGADSLWNNTSGSRNISIGMAGLSSNLSGNANLTFGYSVMNANISGSYNIAFGLNALNSVITSDSNIAIGRESLKNVTTGQNIGIGRAALALATTGFNNTAIGDAAISKNTTGSFNTVIGTSAGGTGGAGGEISENTLIGYQAGFRLAGGSKRNTLIGMYAGDTITTGINNICIGRHADVSSATTSNSLNIGNVLYGSTTAKTIGINVISPTAKLHLPASTAAASSAPLKINTGVLMTTPEAGAIEFDGTNLYFTTSGGTRQTIAVV